MRVGKPVNLARLNRKAKTKSAFLEDLAATGMFCILVIQIWCVLVVFNP